MGNKAKQFFLEMNVKGIMGGDRSRNTNWVVKENNSDSTSIGSFSEDSMNSVCSSSSELTEDASSPTSYLSTSSSSSSHSNGSLCDLSELMNNLPIKRGLSMFYQGKTQSFTSLAGVQSIEDLPKKSIPYSKRMKSCKSYGGGLDSHRISKRMKSCKSYGGGLDSHRIWYSPKATISKKASRGPFASVLSKRGSILQMSRPSIAVHKNFLNQTN